MQVENQYLDTNLKGLNNYMQNFKVNVQNLYERLHFFNKCFLNFQTQIFNIRNANNVHNCRKLPYFQIKICQIKS